MGSLFRGKDNKCVGMLNGEQTVGMNFVIGEKLGGYFTIRKRISLLHMKFISYTENKGIY